MDETSHHGLTASASSDAQILAQLRRGQWSAMEPLVTRYQDRLYSTVLRIVHGPEDAADLVQETFVRAMQNIYKFQGNSSLYTWLFRIAVNLALSHQRSRKYRNAASLDSSLSDELNTQAAGLRDSLSQGTEQNPATAAQVRVDHAQLLTALAGLDPDYRVVIILRDIEDCDYHQIADILDVPVGTVKSRLFRARVALRQAVEPGAPKGVEKQWNADAIQLPVTPPRFQGRSSE